MPSPIPSNIFADGELTNEVKWYTRIFQTINGIIGWGNALPTIQHGTTTVALSSVATVDKAVTYPVAFGSTPSVAYSIGSTSSIDYATKLVALATSTGFTVRVRERTNSAVTDTVTISWVAVGT